MRASPIRVMIPEPLAGGLREIRPHLIYAAGFSALVNLLYLSPALYMLQIYDRVIPTGGGMTLVFISLVVLVALAVLALLDGLRTRLLVRASLRLERMLGSEVLNRQMAVRLHGKAPFPRAHQAVRDFDSIRHTLSGPATVALFDIPWVPIYMVFAFILHPLLGLLALVGSATLLALAVFNERAVKAKLQKGQESTNAGYAAQEEIASQGEVVRALGMAPAMIRRQMGVRRGGVMMLSDALFTGGRYSGAVKFLRLLLQSMALGLGGWLAVERQISIGAVIAASVLISRTLQPIEQLVGSWSSIVHARGAFASLCELFAILPPEPERTRLPEPAGALSLEKVVIRTPDREGLIIKGVTMSVAAGEFVGLIGPSGSGKTTLLRAAAGALTPDGGAVRLDGADLRDWNAERLGRHVGYLPQDCVLFAGSVRDNISRFEAAEGSDGADAEAVDALVVAAAKAAGAHDLILRLPGGYDTVLGARGKGLSSGQVQRLALARALYRDPVLLVLDEPNAHLDGEGEAALVAALTAAKARGAAILVAAHRNTVLAPADRLIVMRDGVLDISGPRDEVVARLSQRGPAGSGSAARKPALTRPAKPQGGAAPAVGDA